MKSIIFLITTLFAMTVECKNVVRGGDPIFDVTNPPAHPFKRSVGDLFGRRHIEAPVQDLFSRRQIEVPVQEKKA